MSFTFIDLFAGIGGFRIPMEQLGGREVAYAEIDNQAIRTYKTNFSAWHNLGDVSQLSTLPIADIVTGGVPCQPWSIAGKGKGFDDPRGRLWLDVIRLITQSQPKTFIFENVKGLTEPRHKDSFALILSELTKSGYTVKWKVLNSYDFGLPQDRERVFIVGIRNDLEGCDRFSFSEPNIKTPTVGEYLLGLEPNVKQKYSTKQLFNDKIPVSRGRFQTEDELNDFFTFSDVRDGHTTIHSWELIDTSDREKFICQTILKNRRRKCYGRKDGNPLKRDVLIELIPGLKLHEINELIFKRILRPPTSRGYDFVHSKVSSGIKGVHKVIMPSAKVVSTLTCTDSKNFIATIHLPCQEPEAYKQAFINQVYHQQKYLALNCDHYRRLQGFPDWFNSHKSNNVAKCQYGNAVSVPVVHAVVKELLKVLL